MSVSSKKVESNEFSLLYQGLRATPLEMINKTKPSEMVTELKAQGIVIDLNTAGAFKVLGKIAHNGSEEDFFAFMTTNEIPPAKLSAKEMDILQGGGWKSFLKSFSDGINCRGVSDGKHHGDWAYFAGLGFGNIKGHGGCEP